MSDFPSQKWEQELVDGLIDAGNENAELSGDGSREKAMENLAKPIADAIKNGGGGIHWVGSLSVEEINNLENPETGGIYGVKDGGEIVNPDGSRITVGPNDVVLWNGEKWASFIDIDLDGYAKKEDVTAAVAAEAALRVGGDAENARLIRNNAEAIESHVADKDNPHEVTAEQVGAYTKEEVDAEIKKESDARELYDSQLRESIEALEEKTGDFVTGEEVSAAISAEADARIQEDIAINARIDMIPQTDWDEEDEGSMAYLQNHPTPISDLDIEALFT